MYAYYSLFWPISEAYSSFLSEKAFLRSALSHGYCQEVHGDICHGHSVQVGVTGGPGRDWSRGLIMDGLGLCGADSRLFPGQTALFHLMSAVFCRAAGPRNRHPAQTFSPVSPLITFQHIWTECAAVRQPCVSLLAAVFGCYRGLLLKPPSQLDEAVIWRLSVMKQASGHVGQTVWHRLLQWPAPFGVRLCWAAFIMFLII